MDIFKLLFFLRGYVNIKISGRFPERFINMCMAKNIYIWNVKKHGKNEFTASMSKKAYALTDEICEKSGTEVSVLSEKGAPLFSRYVITHKIFLAGFFLFILISLYLCTHIWHIEVKESALVPKEQLMEQLEACGIKPGVKSSSIDPDRVKSEILSIMPELEWIWPEVRGTGVYVDLRDRTKKPDIIDLNSPCNLVADSDGLITSVLITEGRGVAEKGMFVSEGQLLAGGLMDNSTVGIRYVHSDGKIYADVNEKLSLTESIRQVKKVKTDGKSIKISFNVGSFKIPLPRLGTPSEIHIKEESTSVLKAGSIYFPFSVTKTVYYNAEERVIKKNEAEIIAKLKEKLEKDLKKSLKDGMIIEKEFNIEKEGFDITVTLTAKCNRQIAVKQPIEEDSDGTEDN